jgi:DNA-binding NarL/FixJ family response regulator
MAKKMINVILADDQVLLRETLGKIISIDSEINVMDMVGTGKEVIASCEKNKPDMILMDIEMPEIDGISALKIIKEKHPEIKVIILTTFENTENIIDAFIKKADGYIVKDIGCEELISTIKCVQYGLTVMHNSVKKIMINEFKNRTHHTHSYTEIISLEEIDIVRLIVNGKSNKEISRILNYSEGTIKNKVSKIYEKLDISDRLQLALYAVENGIE